MSPPSTPTDAPRVWDREAARREPSVKRLILNLIVLGLVVAALSFVAAPFVAFQAIRSAADAADIDGLSKLIDYDAVRSSLRPQLSGRPEAQTPAPSLLQDPIGAVRRQFQQMRPAPVAAPDVDSYLTPRALSGLTRAEGREAAASSGGVTPQASRWPRIAYWGVNRARLSVRRSSGAGPATLFTFERRGPYDWILVHVGLPPAASSQSASSPPATSLAASSATSP